MIRYMLKYCTYFQRHEIIDNSKMCTVKSFIETHLQVCLTMTPKHGKGNVRKSTKSHKHRMNQCSII